MKLLHIVCLIVLTVACKKEKTLNEYCGMVAPNYWHSKAGIANGSSNLPQWEDMRCLARVHKDRFSVEMAKWYRPCDQIYCKISELPFLQVDSISHLTKVDNRARFQIIHGDDAIAQSYDILEDAANWITIDGFSQDSIEIWGRYNLTFVLRNRPPNGRELFDPTFPDTIFMKDGVYTTRIWTRSF